MSSCNLASPGTQAFLHLMVELAVLLVSALSAWSVGFAYSKPFRPRKSALRKCAQRTARRMSAITFLLDPHDPVVVQTLPFAIVPHVSAWA